MQKNKTECKMAIRNEEPHVNKCFPRVCGDVPRDMARVAHGKLFSPRVRGCSGHRIDHHCCLGVFPACAGMFPRGAPHLSRSWGFSPRVRGCSASNGLVAASLPVFPACAGMFLVCVHRKNLSHCFPRVCGDVPRGHRTNISCQQFSPRVRGCSYSLRFCILFTPVFPACAGMFPEPRLGPLLPACFPRVCGDVPEDEQVSMAYSAFSPRVRGCSWEDAPGSRPYPVFPACAGMFLRVQHFRRPRACFPRVCGDVPSFHAKSLSFREFSPRVRGCSAPAMMRDAAGNVFPACAGMFLKPPALRVCGGGFPRVCGDVPPVFRN